MMVVSSEAAPGVAPARFRHLRRELLLAWRVITPGWIVKGDADPFWPIL
jgi:hypothetical protein